MCGREPSPGTEVSMQYRIIGNVLVYPKLAKNKYLTSDLNLKVASCVATHLHTSYYPSFCSLTENCLEPLKNQLAEVDGAIADQQEKIHNLKNKVLHNEEKLHKILNSIHFATK